jgi:hypothetical protein
VGATIAAILEALVRIVPLLAAMLVARRVVGPFRALIFGLLIGLSLHLIMSYAIMRAPMAHYEFWIITNTPLKDLFWYVQQWKMK